MKLGNPPSILRNVAILVLSSTIAANAADSFSDADKAFVAKVSQGGMYEVELGKLAETKALTQDLKDQGNTEARQVEVHRRGKWYGIPKTAQRGVPSPARQNQRTAGR